MKFLSHSKTIIYSLLVLLLVSSCSKEIETETFDNSSLISVKLQGTNSLLSHANIEVLDVQIKVLENDENPNAWVSLNTVNTGIHDLANITDNDVVTLVDFEEIPAGFIYSIKLILGDRNAVVKNGVTYNLDIAPEFENASTNVVYKQLKTNVLYDFLIEFDVDRSVVFSQEGTVNLNPQMSTLLRRFELF